MKWRTKEFIKDVINELMILISNVFWIVLVVGGLMINRNFLGLVGIGLMIFTLIFIGLFIYAKNNAHKKYKITSKSIISNDEATFSMILGIINSFLMIFGILKNYLSIIVVVEILVLMMIFLYVIFKMMGKDCYDIVNLDELKAEVFKKSSVMLIISFWIYLVLIFNFIAFFDVKIAFSSDVIAFLMTIFVLSLIFFFIYCFKKIHIR
ncbi:hypothetical protein [Methanocaldococcus bathoardescens]|uniref:hypothetical protein n=1 Tax=Methanocaldococcus bathoardescens TaxID=1301915 RepID=UPI00064E3C4B|nr:hypothetical protein [Methanocaldococcus bathoardescens]